MRFDDRLKTVMTQPVGDAHDRTVRWRQLVDLLSRRHGETDPALLDAALSMVRSGMRTVARPIRAATARSISGRPIDPGLMAIFASDKLEVAAPLLASASFDEEGWAKVASSASAEVADFIRSLRGEAPPPPEPAPEPEAAPPEEPVPSIGELAARIERLRTRRETSVAFEPPPRPDPAVQPPPASNLFRWECDASGQIGWVEGAPRGAVIGRSLPADEQADRRLIRAFTDRLPFDDAPLTFAAPALEGEWRLSGIPAFSPADGRFLGYRGIARRESEEEEDLPMPSAAVSRPGDAEVLRETIHEIKTPLNAIIGFAEIIDGQYLGPAHRNYRHRAAEIVDQARILLAAIEDLDFAARIQTRGKGDQPPADLAEILPPIADELQRRAEARRIKLRIDPLPERLHFRLDRDVAERLLRRLGGALIDAAAAEESLVLSIREEKGRCAISITRPISTVHLAEKQLLDPTFSTAEESEGTRLGLGFALRLVRGLVRLAGGVLRFGPEEITVVLPALKG